MSTGNLASRTLVFALQPFFYFYLTKDINFWLLISISLNLYGILGLIFFMDESPLFLLKIGKIESAENIIRRMKNFNGVKEK